MASADTPTQQSHETSKADIKEIKTVDVIKYIPAQNRKPERYLVYDVDNKNNPIYITIIEIPNFPKLEKGQRYMLPISGENNLGPEIRKSEFDAAFEGQGLIHVGPSDNEKLKTEKPTKQQSLENTLPPVDANNKAPDNSISKESTTSDRIEDEAIEAELFPISENLPVTENKFMMLNDFGLPAKKLVEAHFEHYNFIKELMLNQNHFVILDGKPYLKKEGWFSLGEGFGISRDEHDIMEERVWTDDIGEIHVYYRVRVVMPNGRAAVDIGVCSSSEKGRSKAKMHDIYATALTRATVRAISFLIGKGSISAEEVN